jgi:hypothetical protein
VFHPFCKFCGSAAAVAKYSSRVCAVSPQAFNKVPIIALHSAKNRLNRVNRRAANSDEWLNSPRHWAGGSKSAQQQRCYRLPGESRPRPRHCWCQLELGDAGES